MLLRMVTVARVKLKKKRKQSRKRGQQAQRLAVKNGVQPGVVADALEGSMAAQGMNRASLSPTRYDIILLEGIPRVLWRQDSGPGVLGERAS